ncbi:MAG: MarR family transcriptional regulator [Chloroflexi bacterium]|nr:MarR family transcriptional regulator [Chloroflexota bacterium]
MSSRLHPRPSVADVQAELRGLATEIDRLDSLAAECFGLNRTDLRCLELLGRAGALTPTELARALDFTTGGVTTVIDRLEQAGYARRRPDPADRRRVIVQATARVGRREAEVFGQLIRSTESLLSAYSDAQLATIRDFLTRSRMTVATHADSLVQRAAPGRVPAARRPARVRA